MTSNQNRYESARLIIKSSLFALLLLAVLLVAYSVAAQSFRIGPIFLFIAVAAPMLLLARYFLRRNYYRTASWTILLLYMLASFFILLLWGTSTPIGILILGFIVIIPSVLMGAALTFPAISIAVLLLVFVQLLHATNIVTPETHALNVGESHWQIFIYATLLTIIGLISWLSSRQRDVSLQRALRAEASLQAQKETLKHQLAEESKKLRLTQLEQINDLHNFAVLGQTTAATLHDVSNHLSLLNLDIEDLSNRRHSSKTIASAKRSIYAINVMIRESRKQLDTLEHHAPFDAIAVVRQSIKKVRRKYIQQNIRLTKLSTTGNSFTVTGNSYALTQIITILLNNALDACRTIPEAKVTTKATITPTELVISVLDNGKGIDPALQAQLFKPKLSKKATGLGVGLYLAYHLTQSVFNGTLELVPSDGGAHFRVTIPRVTTD